MKRAVNGFPERIERMLATSNPFNLFRKSVDSTSSAIYAHPSTI
jgi:hypothetical protein